jgi:hypothetical protein
MKRKSRVIDEMTATFADLKKSGLVSKKQLIEFEALKTREDRHSQS